MTEAKRARLGGFVVKTGLGARQAKMRSSTAMEIWQ